jgi:nitroreductase
MDGALPRAAGVDPARPTRPYEAFDPQLVSRVIAVAGRAPSLHNTPPWTWRLHRDRLELRADRDRQSDVGDRDGHSLRISCGAALALAELAFAGEGVLPHTERLPDPDQPDLLASFTEPRSHECTATEREELAAAARRYSERRSFLSRAVPDDLVVALRAVAGGGGVHAHFPVREAEKLDMVMAVNWVERRDAAYLAELTRWLQAADVHAEGIPSSAMPPVLLPGHPRHTDLPLRDVEVGLWSREQIAADPDERPLTAVLLSESDTPREQLAAGESMMRLMLQAERAGLATCPLSQVVDLVASRARIRTLMGWSGYPQMMLRVGYPPPGCAPRWPVTDQLDAAEARQL